MRDNVSDADNQQETLRVRGSSETIRRAPFTKRQELKAYLFGAMHDGWIRQSDHRYRIAQKGTELLKVIQKSLHEIGYRSWIYQEGKDRDVFIRESVAPIFREHFDPYTLVSKDQKIAYIKGFFDAEGGIPKNLTAKRYIQLVQKDFKKILLLKTMLAQLGIQTGKIHNPSKRVDPNYWRIFVSRNSISRFVSKNGSWHPRKQAIFNEWMMI